MADRKVYITAKVDLILVVEEGIELDDVMNDLQVADSYDCHFEIEDYNFTNYEVTDSK
jgi:hypothetical protein